MHGELADLMYLAPAHACGGEDDLSWALRSAWLPQRDVHGL